MQEKKISCPPEKKSKAKNNDDVRKVVISDKFNEVVDKTQGKKNFCPSEKKSKVLQNINRHGLMTTQLEL